MSIQDLKKRFVAAQANPSIFKNIALEYFEDTTRGGNELLDPSNPVLFTLETACAAASAAIDKTEVNSRSLYKTLATSYDDIYKHMSGEDYKDRFSSPSSMRVRLALPLTDILNSAVPVPGTDTRKITIGADTEYVVSGVSFYQQYPIDIIINSKNNIQVRYDTLHKNNIKDSRDLDIKWLDDFSDGRKILLLVFTVDQLKLVTLEDQLVKSSGYNKSILLDDSFYYAEAFYKKGTDWLPIETTHSGQVYDSTRPTMILTVGEDNLKMRIPEIYLTEDLISGIIKVNVYTTKGELKLLTSSIPPVAYAAYWKNASGNSKFTSPMGKIVDFMVWSEEDVDGGTNGIPFEDLRESIVYSSKRDGSHVSFESLEYDLKSKGYQLSKLEEHVLGRSFLASTSLKIENSKIFSNLGTRLFTFNIDAASDVYGDSIFINGRTATITPKALFRSTGSTVEVLTESEKDTLLSSNINNIIFNMNNEDYYNTPFYLVLDSENSSFDLRTYYLDSPKIESRKFVANNPSVGYYVNTLNTKLEKTKTGYEMVVVAEVPELLNSIDNIFVQLSISSGLDSSPLYVDSVKGVVNDSTVKFTIPISTRYLIDVDNSITINNVKDLLGNVIDISVPLESFYNLTYVTETNSPIPSALDDHANESLHVQPITVLSRERGELVFGEHLPNYYSEGNAIKSEPVYERHSIDVYETYQQDVMATDVDGNIIYTNTGNNYDVTYSHRAGDFILDQNGDKIIKHRVGDVVYVNNMPKIIEDSKLIREVTYPLFDAAYSLATTSDVVKYRKEIAKDISNRLRTVIDPLAQSLLERTELKFAPSNTSGIIDARLTDNRFVRINSSLKLTVNVTLSRAAYAEENIRSLNKSNILSAILESISKRRVSTFDIYKNCQAATTEDVVGLTIEGFDPDGGLLTIEDPLDNLTLASKLVLKTDGTIDIVDDVSFNWLAV